MTMSHRHARRRTVLSLWRAGCEVADDPEQQQRREQEQQVTALQQQAVQQVQGEGVAERGADLWHICPYS